MKKLLLQIYIFTVISFLTFSINASDYKVFSQDCRAIDDDYLKFEVILEDSNKIQPGQLAIIKATAFEDDSCQTPYLVFNQYFEVQNIDQTNIDLKTKSTSYQIFSSETAEALNYIHFCNQSNWQPQIELEVTGLKCGDYQQLKANQLFYQIFKLTDNQLQWGITTSARHGREASKRPTEFDLFYKK